MRTCDGVGPHYTKGLTYQGRRKVSKFGGGRGLISYVIGIICPLGRNRVNWSVKEWGASAPCTQAPTALLIGPRHRRATAAGRWG